VSQLNSADRGVVVPKARPNIYTALLAISLLAIITGIVLLSMELGRYNWKIKPAPSDLNGLFNRPAGAAPYENVEQAFDACELSA
jgi:hypothetical protein